MSWLLVGLLVYAVGCWMLALSYISPMRRHPVRPAGASEVSISGSPPFPAWCTPGLAAGGSKRKVLFVLVHGYGGDRGSWSEMLVELDRRGYEAVAPAMPAHDANPDPTCGFGVKEAETVIHAASWAQARFAKPPKTVLVGISMGGAACWLAVERARADAIVSEGSFAVLDDAVRRWFDLLLPGGHVILAPVRWLAKVRSGVDPSTVRPVDGAARWRGRPALVIQGDRDRLMEMSQAKTLSEAAGCPLWVVPGAEHAQCQNLAPAEYVRRLSELADALAH